MMASASERAALRRATWKGRVAHSFREAEEHDVEYWLAATPEQRIRAVTELTAEMLAMEGVLSTEPPTSEICWRNSAATRLSSFS